MKPASRLSLFALAGASLALIGCTKKPVRPYPSETVMGPQNGGALNPQEVSTVADQNSGLQQRGPGEFDANGQMRGVLPPVFFDFDRSSIRPSERGKAQAAKAYLDQNPQYRMLLEGYCDWRGTAEYNLALGDRRASEVKKYLLTLGVSPDRLDTLSKGSEEATKTTDESALQHDRRVEFVILQPQAQASPAAAAAAAPAAADQPQQQ